MSTEVKHQWQITNLTDQPYTYVCKVCGCLKRTRLYKPSFKHITKYAMIINGEKKSTGTKCPACLKPTNDMSQKSLAKTSINYIPLHDRCVIMRDEAEKTTKGGIIIPDTAKEDKARGIVVAIGAGIQDRPFTVELGDYVSFSKFAGSEEEVDGIKYTIMRETDIFGILPPKKAETKATPEFDFTSAWLESWWNGDKTTDAQRKEVCAVMGMSNELSQVLYDELDDSHVTRMLQSLDKMLPIIRNEAVEETVAVADINDAIAKWWNGIHAIARKHVLKELGLNIQAQNEVYSTFFGELSPELARDITAFYKANY